MLLNVHLCLLRHVFTGFICGIAHMRCSLIASSEPVCFLSFKMLSCGVLSQVTELPFFASRVWLGRNGVEEIYPLGPLNEYERSEKRFLISSSYHSKFHAL